MENFFETSNKLSVGEEEIKKVIESDHFYVEKIISYIAKSPEGYWYDQDKNEWVIVLEGTAVLKIEQTKNEIKEITLTKGQSLLIPAHQKHRVESTSEKCVWLCIFSDKEIKVCE